MSELPAVTILSGFLGAGKTTLLRNLVLQNEGQPWALVVNDVGALNIDAALLGDLAAHAGSGAELVELSNGCVCCSNKGDLAETLCRLGAQGKFEHILVETTGLAEPAAIAPLFLQKNSFGRSVGDFARLHCLVTVVDCPDLLARLEARDKHPADGSIKPLVELIIEQAECADLILLNKADRCTEEGLLALEGLLSGLNPHAELLRTEYSQASAEWILGRPRFDPKSTLGAALWITGLNAAVASDAKVAKADAQGTSEALPEAEPRATGAAKLSVPDTAHAPIGYKGSTTERAQEPQPRTAQRSTPEYTRKYALRSFLYRARRPFNQARLTALLDAGLPNIVRAKGFIWIAERPDEMGFLSLAGGAHTQTWLNYWWATMIESGRARLDQRPPLVRGLWEEPHGDRRQELVFIGVNYNEAELRRRLEGCLT